jgi:hypothetical protein
VAAWLSLAVVMHVAAAAAGPVDAVRPHALTPTPPKATKHSQVPELLRQGRAALRAGQVDEALARFAHAADLEHSAQVEQHLLRAHMQGGHYRRALAFAAHVAQAHDSPSGAAWHAHLLALGGQQALATQAQARVAALAAAHNAGHGHDHSHALVDDESNSDNPETWGPAVQGDTPSAQAQLVSAGTLLADGKHVLVPAALLPMHGRVWVRDGLGQTREARRVIPSTNTNNVLMPQAQGVAVLMIADPLTGVPSLTAAQQPAHAGAPALVMRHAAQPGAQATWPQMHTQFLAMPQPPAHTPSVARPSRPALPGGPVFDVRGAWLGVTVPGVRDDVLLLAAAMDVVMLTGALSDPAQAQPVATPTVVNSTARASRMPLDELYERAMRNTVQVIVDRPR